MPNFIASLKMVKQKTYSAVSKNSTSSFKKSIDSNQRTLFQCWGKATPFSANNVEVIGDCPINMSRPQKRTPKPPDRSSSSDLEKGMENVTVSQFRTRATFKETRPQRRCPFYKKVEGTPYAVDAFNYVPEDEIKAYFLTHFHSDHYAGLGPRFSRPIYCSEVTADLVRLVLKVPQHSIFVLPLDNPTMMPDGTQVHLINSNHCPGAVMFVFRLKNGRVILHTGDMRADEAVLVSCENLLRNLPRVDALHLDTTYCDASYSFPPQMQVIEQLMAVIKVEVRQRQRLLILVGAYQIGKERVFKAIAEMLNVKIYVGEDKLKILHCIKDAALSERLTLNPGDTPLHVVAMNCLNNKKLADYLSRFSGSYDHILGISATGWEFCRNRNGYRTTRRDNTTLIGVPYSEHSSFNELAGFVQMVKPRRVVPTVNVGSESSRKKMQDYFSLWLR